MKSNIIIIHILCASLICCVSCESAIDLGDDGLGTVLLMNAQLCTSDTTHIVMLARSSQEGFSPVEKATINCYVNDKLVSKSDKIDENQEVTVGANFDTGKMYEKSYSLLHFEANFKPGDVVCIKAGADNLQCESCVTVPPAPSIKNVKMTECESDVEKQFGDYKFEIQVEDIPSDINYYSLKLWDKSYVLIKDFDEEYYNRYYGFEPDLQPGDTLNFNSEEIEINNTRDPLFNSGGETVASSINPGSESYLDNKYNLFTDYMFRDKSYSITVYGPHIYIHPTTREEYFTYVSNNTVRVRLLNLSKEEYQYLTGFQFDGSTESGTYFTSDYIYPTNIKNGLGFVSISSSAEYDVHISSYYWDKHDRRRID